MALLASKSVFKNWFQQSGLKIVPKNFVSRLFGQIVATQLPKIAVKAQIEWFIRQFKIDTTEIKKPLNEFSSLQEFFIRELKSGARKIDAGQDSVVAPCDGFWGQSGKVQKGTLLQIKGRSYRLDSLLGDVTMAKKLEDGQFATFYLSPQNYHHFHMPISGQIFEATHIPGHLWPVNLMAVKNIDKLFCVNERLVMMVRQDVALKKFMAIVAVGATMVGKVKVKFDDQLVTNRASANPNRHVYEAHLKEYKKGVLLGRFEFGSTLVVVSSKDLLSLEPKKPGDVLKMGTKIGTLKNS